MCTNPYKIIRPDHSTMMVGCGHCLQCLKAYQDSWTARLNEELKSWSPIEQDGKSLKPVIFFTLDYRPESIPCRYLVVTHLGVRIQDERPDCTIFDFWTDTRRESHDAWLSRRSEMLRIFHRYSKLVWSLQDRRPSADEVRAGLYRYDGSQILFDVDIPSDVEFLKYGDGLLEHPIIDYDVLKEPSGSFGLGVPLVAFEFHTVSKTDVQNWNKRGRIRLTRKYPSIFDNKINPRFISNWIDSSGVSHSLPSCALPKNVKFFITSEYGPLTHRPHYHGVMFGVSYDEFKECFADDWERSFGHCDFSVLRSSGGAITYLSKYCSKGSYEHPYCCKDIVYPSGKEFHSSKFFNCVEDFGLNIPMVIPTFHLISKGLGANYAFSSEIQNYFGVVLSDYVTDNGVCKYISKDGALIKNYRPSISFDKLLVVNDGESAFKSTKISFLSNGDVKVLKFDNNDCVIGESIISADSIVSSAIEQILSKTLYSRSYVKQNFYGKNVPGRCLPCWHKIGLTNLCNPTTVTSTLRLPRYYRQWLVSPLASMLRQSFAIVNNPSIDEIESGLLRQGRPRNEVSSLVVRLMASDTFRNALASQKLRKSAESFFYPNGFKNLE